MRTVRSGFPRDRTFPEGYEARTIRGCRLQREGGAEFERNEAPDIIIQNDDLPQHLPVRPMCEQGIGSLNGMWLQNPVPGGPAARCDLL